MNDINSISVAPHANSFWPNLSQYGCQHCFVLLFYLFLCLLVVISLSIMYLSYISSLSLCLVTSSPWFFCLLIACDYGPY